MSENIAPYTVTFTPKTIVHASAREAKRLAKTIADTDAVFKPPQPEIIKGLFQSQGWTQIAVARALKTDPSTIRRWTAPVDQKQYSPIPFTEWLLLMIMAGEITHRQIHVQ